MPHVIVKLWPGRTEDQKQELTDRIVKAVMESIQVEAKSVSVALEEISPEKWAKDVYGPDIIDKAETLYKKPGYVIEE